MRFLEGTKVYFSKHALDRTKERRIERKHIEQIFEFGSVIKIEPARTEGPIDLRQRLDKISCQCYVESLSVENIGRSHNLRPRR